MIAYVIGFRNSFRGAELLEQLALHDLKVRQIEGVKVEENQNDDETFSQEAARVLLRREMTLGEVGCALAHRSSYLTFLESEESCCLIFEDDSRLSPFFNPYVIEEMLDTEEPRLIMLFSQKYETYLRPLKKGDAELGIYGAYLAPYMASGYAINRAAGVILAKETDPIRYVADWPPSVVKKINFYIAHPVQAFIASDAESTLNSARKLVENTSETKLRKVLRHAAALLHLTWFSKGQHYGDYATYLNHELLRFVKLRIAKAVTRKQRKASDGPFFL